MYRLLKRLIDLLISFLALLVLMPLFIPVMLLLLLTGEHEVFYLQERVGYRNKPFKLIKFATMVKNSLNIGAGDVTEKNDPRVLPLGKYLRKSKINELPQLFNVFFGSMSIVGARPLHERTFSKYSEEVKAVINNTPPGITGIGSVVFRDEERLIGDSNLPIREFYDHHILPYKGELEVWYQENKSLWLDIQIVFFTAYVISFPRSEIVFKVFKTLPERPEYLQPN